MLKKTRGPARTLLKVVNPLDLQEIEGMRETGTLRVEQGRRRSRFFDGRFLAARDLTREQNYFLSRQADLGRALGVGVVSGLLVSPGENAFSVSISPGHGVTQSGELVVIPDGLTVRLADVPEIQRLNGALRLSSSPHTPARSRSGLFILALRPVEFTANPIASYPTSIDGERSVEDGDIIEGVAVTLVPYRDQGAATEMNERRSQAAREIFVNGGDAGLPGGLLPLAMLALDRNGVQWIDQYLVRREVGAEHGDILNFGFASRSLKEAYLFQYEAQLSEIMARRERGGGQQSFAAADYFDALPPAGRMPAAAIERSDLTQTFFPTEMDVELSIVPEDEIPALLEESMRLPPIDLTLSGEELESTSVVVLIPVERYRLRGLKSSLSDLRNVLRPAAPGIVSQRKPIEALQGLRVVRLYQPFIRPVVTADARWVDELNRAAAENDGLLWYMRRRNLSYKSEVTGAPVAVEGDEADVERVVETRISDIVNSGLVSNFGLVRTSATTRANAEIVSSLSSPVFGSSRLLLASAMKEIEDARPDDDQDATLTKNDIIKVTERYTETDSGEGITRLETDNTSIRDDDAVMTKLVESGAVPELDKIARILPEEERKAFADDLVNVATRDDAAAVRRLITDKLNDATLRLRVR